MSAAWLAPPLDLKTVCVRLKAAVEEREAFYRMTPSVAAEPLEIPDAPFDVFLSFNFLEHQPDPVSMLRCMHHNLTDGGIGLITVPSFEYIHAR